MKPSYLMLNIAPISNSQLRRQSMNTTTGIEILRNGHSNFPELILKVSHSKRVLNNDLNDLIGSLEDNLTSYSINGLPFSMKYHIGFDDIDTIKPILDLLKDDELIRCYISSTESPHDQINITDIIDKAVAILNSCS